MIRRLVERPTSVVVASLGLVVLGAASLARLPVSLLPALERPRLVVEVTAPELGAEALARRVVAPLERELLSLDDVATVTATVTDGAARLVAESAWGVDADLLRLAAERRLPATGAASLRLRVEDGDVSPLLTVAITGAVTGAVLGGSADARAVFAEEVVVADLASVAGAGRVRRVGGARLHPVVRPRAADLVARGLTAADVEDRLRDLGATAAIGEVAEGAVKRPVSARWRVSSLADLGDLALGERVRLADVATLAVEPVAAPAAAWLDGEEAVLVEVFRAPGANAVALARAVTARAEALARRAPPGLALRVVEDRSREVRAAVVEIGLAAALGFVAGTLVLRWMLGSWRPTLVLALVVPAAVVASFALFLACDVALDLVSLAGLALAAGMLVDGAVVVLEAIAAERTRDAAAAPAPDVADPAVRGAETVALPLLAGLLTTGAVFVPLLYLRGIARAWFGVQAFALLATLALSVAFALTLTPVVARLAGAGTGGGRPGGALYARALAATLARPTGLVVALVALLAAGAAAAAWLPRELVPLAASRTLAVDLRLPPGAPRGEAEARLVALERRLRVALPVAGSVSRLFRDGDVAAATHDAAAIALDDEGSARLELRLAAGAGEDRDAILATARAMVAATAGFVGTVDWRRDAVTTALLRGSGAARVVASAASERRLAELVRRLGPYLAVTPEVAAPGRGAPSLEVIWDEPRLAALGADRATLEAQLAAALGERRVGRAEIPGVDADVWLAPTEPARLAILPLRAAAHRPPVPLAALARLEPTTAAPPRERRDGWPSRRLVSSLPVAELEARLATVALGADQRVELVGEVATMRRSFAQLRFALLLGAVLVLLTVAALYESLLLPWVVASTVPVAAAGAALALVVAGESWNVLSLLALVLLTGIVVNNAIVLLHRAEEHRRGGVAVRRAIARAAGERLRPISMTTVTTVLGMLPLAILPGAGATLRRSLAVAVAGGVATAWAATLFVVPALYLWARTRREPAPGQAEGG